MVLGVGGGHVVGVPPFEAKDLALAVQRLIGVDGPRWDFERIPVNGCDVIVDGEGEARRSDHADEVAASGGISHVRHPRRLRGNRGPSGQQDRLARVDRDDPAQRLAGAS